MIVKTIVYSTRHVIRLLDPGLLIVAGIGAFLRFSRLGDHDNQYYTATVASMLQSARNFFFASFDSAGVVMVDKPPVSFWIQAVPAYIVGVSKESVTFPQIIIGTLAIVILYWSLRPVFGRTAAIIAALVLAVVPASVLIDSRNEPDSALSFILMLAAFSIVRAVQTGKWRWLIAFGVLMGIGFNTKMLVAFIPLPAFLLYYVLTIKYPIRRIVIRVTFTLALLFLVSVSWITLISLTPSENRPYVGSTPDDSIWTLVFKYNGINRFTSFTGPSVRQLPSQPPLRLPDQYGQSSTDVTVPVGLGAPQAVQATLNNSVVQDTGPLALFSNPLANQLGWLLPVGVISLFIVFVPFIPEAVYRRPITVLRILRTSPMVSQSLLWGVWLTTGLVVFGLANSTTTHPYYLVGVAVPLAATIGISSSLLFRVFPRGGIFSWLVVVVLVIGAGYQVYGASTFVGDWVIAIVIAGVLMAVLVMVIGIYRKVQNQPLSGSAVVFGASALLIIPLIVSLTAGNRTTGPNLAIPEPVSMPRPVPREMGMANLSRFLMDQSPSMSRITLGMISAREAAPFIVDGIPSIAIGGFSGNDPVFNIHSFEDMAALYGPRYFLMPDRQLDGMGRGTRQKPILDHIRNHWRDISWLAGLPLGTLYINPRWTHDE